MNKVSAAKGMDDETLRLRLEAARAAQQRSRFAFLATTLISVTLLLAAWNAYFSFYYAAAVEFAHPNGGAVAAAPGATSGSAKEAIELQGRLRQVVFDEWARSRLVSIPPLGVKVGIDDGPLLGGIALAIALVWFNMSIRSESQVISTLLRDAQLEADQKRERVFHGISDFSVFTVLREPHSSLAVSLASILWYFPALCVAFLLLADFISATMLTSPFRDSQAPPFDGFGTRAAGLQILRWFGGTFALVLTFLLCHGTRQLNLCTETALERFREALPDRKPPPCDNP